MNRTAIAEMSTILPNLINRKWFDILLSKVSTTEKCPHWRDLLPDPKSPKRRSFGRNLNILDFDNLYIEFSSLSIRPVKLTLLHSSYF